MPRKDMVTQLFMEKMVEDLMMTVDRKLLSIEHGPSEDEALNKNIFGIRSTSFLPDHYLAANVDLSPSISCCK
jgi:hypothetical protein